jgi:hypothetical protein
VHRRGQAPYQSHRGQDIHLVERCPIGGRRVPPPAVNVGGGIVDQDIHASQYRDRIISRPRRAIVSGEIAHDRDGETPNRHDLFGDLLSSLGIAAMHSDGASLGGEDAGDLLTDTTAATGHQRSLPVQSQIHAV